MNVSELFSLTKWIHTEITQAGIAQRYQELYAVLYNNTQPNQTKQPFEAQKENLVLAIQNVPLYQLTKDQLVFLDNLGIGTTVGDQGIAVVEDILFKNAIDVASAAQRIQAIAQSLSAGTSKAEQLRTGLTDCVSEEPYELNDEILMRIGFKGDASLNNVVDFKSWGSAWYDIGRGIAMAHGGSPEDVKIIGATKGSIILELSIAAGMVTTISGIILAALKVAEKVLDIRKKAEEIRGLKLTNDKIAHDLETAADKEKAIGIEAIAKDFTDQLGIATDGEGDKVKALESAVKHLVVFLEKGGDVDFVLPEDEELEDDAAEKHQQLRVAFQEIRYIERKLALIEHKP